MATRLNPISYLNLATGLITEGAVGEYRVPQDAVTESLNFKFNRIGSATLREGTTRLGNQLSGDLLGLYEFRDSGAGSNNQIIAVNADTVYYLSSGTWTARRTGLTTGAKARFATFVDYVFMVNGSDSTAVWDGNPANAFSTGGNASGAPTGKFIENFKSRVWIAGNTTYPDRVFYSSIPTAVTTPVITWDTNVITGQWIDVSPSDGENITGLKRAKTALLVFKNNHIYRIANVEDSEPDPSINVGTYSAESIIEAKDGIYFHHPSGFYRYIDGSIYEISKPIVDILTNITVANYSKICGWLEKDGDNIVWSVGTVTIDGVSFANLEVRYTISTQVWTHYTKPTQALVASRYNDGTTLFQLFGDDNGNIQKADVGLTDNGTPISYSLEHRWYQIDGLSSTRKNITKLLFAHENGNGTNINFQVDGDVKNDWSKSVGQLQQFNTGFNNTYVRGRKCRFRISGSSVGEPFTYSGFEVLDGSSELVIF